MPRTHKIRALIWDLGGVILRTEVLSYREIWEKHFGFGPWELEKLIFRSEMSRRASVGKASTDDIWASVQEQLNLTDKELGKLRVDFFAGDRIDKELVSFIRSLRGSYRTGMITNAWPDIRQWMENEVRIADAFDDIVISSEVGIVKPNREIYLLSLKGLGVQPDEAIFVDDFTENLEGAEELGMQVIHFQDPLEVMDTIRELLNLSP